GVEQNRSRVPAILHRQRVEFAEDTGEARLRKAIDCDDPNMPAADARFDPRAEIVSSEQFIQVHGNIGQSKRVILTRNAATKVPKERVMILWETVLVHEFMSLQPLDLKQR